MKVGNLIKWSNPKLDGTFATFVGLVIDAEASGMIKVMFNGFKYPRWVCHTQCEATKCK